MSEGVKGKGTRKRGEHIGMGKRKRGKKKRKTRGMRK